MRSKENKMFSTVVVLIIAVSFNRPKYKGVECRPQFAPLSSIMPGGQGVTYLSNLTQGLADDMSQQISLGSEVVSAVGDAIQRHESVSSDKVRRISDIVDSQYRRRLDDEEDEDEKGHEEEDERMHDSNLDFDEDELMP